MATQPRLVNKQFNSPIGLYSRQNVQEVLERETQILANGAVGINFQNPDVGKPSNLKNSAVLRMLEEEESRQRNGYGPGNEYLSRPLRENVTWPPPEYEHKNQLRSTFKDVVIPGAKRVAWPPPNESALDGPLTEQSLQNSSVPAQGGPQYPAQAPVQQHNYQAPAQRPTPHQPARSPLKPLDISSHGSSPLASPLQNQSPQAFRPATPSRGWAPVHSPVGTGPQPNWQQPSARFQAAHQPVSQQTYLGQQYQASPQQYQSPQNQFQSQPQNQPLPNQYQPPQQQYQPPQTQYQPPQQQYQPPQNQYQPPQQQSQPPQNQYQPPQNQYQPPQQQYQPPQNQYQSPQQQYQPPQQQYQPPQQQYQPPQQQYQPPQQQYQPPQTQNQPPQQQYQPPQQNQPQSPRPGAAPIQVAPRPQSTKPVEPPPSIITLRPQAPVSQAPPPVITSQPATATLRGGKHLRGDLKWPPEEVRVLMAEENRLLLELAKGPAVRPKRPNKDYTDFYSQHALNSTYPGYKIPPGTQFYRPE